MKNTQALEYLLEKKDPIQPSEEDIRLAAETAQKLAAYAENEVLRIRIMEEGSESIPLDLPAPAVSLLIDLLQEMGKGNAVTLIPYNAQLTTQKAADFLKVSQPFVVELCDRGELPYSHLGKHRTISFADVIEFKRKSLVKSHQALDELAALHQEMDGYAIS